MVYLSYGHVESLILATLALDNMLMTSSAKNIYCPTGLCNTEDINRELTLGLQRNDNCADLMLSLEKPTRSHNASIAAKEIRNTDVEYFMNEGAMGQMLNEEDYRYLNFL